MQKIRVRLNVNGGKHTLILIIKKGPPPYKTALKKTVLMLCLLHDQKFSLLFYSEILNVMLSTILFVFEHNFNFEINYGCTFSGTPDHGTMGLKTRDTTDVFLSKSEGIILVSVNIFIFNLNQNVNNYCHVNIF